MGNKIIYIRTSKFSTRTLGRFLVLNKYGKVIFECYGLELPDKGNKPFVSCIPAGVYQVKKLKSSNAFDYAHLWIMDVPHRSGIKIHIGNYVSQLHGCIATGMSALDIDKDRIIDMGSSKEALSKLLDSLPERTTIEILETES